jgi:lipopolysaccharide biosynthesis glycosyltransferase
MRVFIGWDSRENDAYEVCVHTLLKHSSIPLDIVPLKQKPLRIRGLYTREETAVSTEFAFTRFLTPHLSDYSGWSLFIDCDFLFTKDVAELYNMRDDQYALMCVKHDYVPKDSVKMDGQKQVAYPRKNWSSCILWNCGHESNQILTPQIVNSESGAFLHRFQWLDDREIGELPLEWNWLEGEYDKPENPPAVIHYTNGGPWFEECQDVDYADLWNESIAESKNE